MWTQVRAVVAAVGSSVAWALVGALGVVLLAVVLLLPWKTPYERLSGVVDRVSNAIERLMRAKNGDG